MLKIAGRFSMYSGNGDEINITFSSDDVADCFSQLHPFLEMPSILTFDEQLKLDGVIHSYSGKRNKISLYITMDDESDNVQKLVSLRGKTIMLEAKIDKSKPMPLRKVDHQFMSKIRATIWSVARYAGILNSELEPLIKDYWGNPQFSLTTNTYHVDAEEYYNAVKRYIIDNKIPGVLDASSIDSVKMDIRRARREKKCIICGLSTKDSEGIFSLCTEHKREFLKLGKEAFMKLYHLDQETL